MDLLDHAGWVSPDPDRPRNAAWLVNPRIHTLFAKQAAAECARREANRKRLLVSIADLAHDRPIRPRGVARLGRNRTPEAAQALETSQTSLA